MRFSQIILAASSAALSEAVFISNDASSFTGLTVGVAVPVSFKDSVGPTELYEAQGTGNNVAGQKLVGSAPAGATGTISWSPTSGGSDITLVIVDTGAGDATPTNYVGPLSVSGPTASSSSSSATTTSPTGSTTSSVMTTSASVLTTVVPVNTTTLIHSSTKVYALNTTTTPASGAKTTGNGATTPAGNPTQVPSNSASGIASPLAFVFLALAALVTLN